MKERNYGIDLLRLVLMFLVCMIHILGFGGILSSCSPSSVKYYIFHFMDAVAMPAVDAFAIISGYMAKDKKQNYSKIVSMWFQVFFYSFILTVILRVIGMNPTMPLNEFIGCALPITFSKYWYFTGYFALFFIMPMLNKFVFSLDNKTAKKVILFILLAFSFFGFYFDTYRMQGGYSAIWLAVLYVLGALAKKVELLKNVKTINLWVICITSCIVETIGVSVLQIKNIESYISPANLIAGLIMVLIAERLKFSKAIGKKISSISKLSFGVYLFHLNQIFFSGIIFNSFGYVIFSNPIKGVIEVLIITLIIFITGLIVEYIRQKVYELLKVDKLSVLITNTLEKVLDKIVEKF